MTKNRIPIQLLHAQLCLILLLGFCNLANAAVCPLTGQTPVPRNLVTCPQYKTSGCCSTVVDAAIKAKWDQWFGAGEVDVCLAESRGCYYISDGGFRRTSMDIWCALYCAPDSASYVELRNDPFRVGGFALYGYISADFVTRFWNYFGDYCFGGFGFKFQVERDFPIPPETQSTRLIRIIQFFDIDYFEPVPGGPPHLIFLTTGNKPGTGGSSYNPPTNTFHPANDTEKCPVTTTGTTAIQTTGTTGTTGTTAADSDSVSAASGVVASFICAVTAVVLLCL